MEINLKNKISLVTAGSEGIGFGIAKSFYNAGANVCICSRDKDKLDRAINNICGSGDQRVLSIQGDVGDKEFLDTLVPEVEKRFDGTIDILVNNSGGPPPGAALELTEKQWDDSIKINLLSVIRLSTLIAPGMKIKKWGRIINLTSTTAKEPAEGMALSNVTRAGVAAYSKTLANELGPFGVTVNTILTGSCMTGRMSSLVEKSAEREKKSVEEIMESIKQSIPVRYVSDPEEFSRMILFLASDLAGYITGVSIPIDGGRTKSMF